MPELRATIEIAIKRRATRLGKGIFLVEKDSPSITTYTREEVLTAIPQGSASRRAKINDEGWVAPIKAKIKGYCTGFDMSPGMTDYPDFCLWPAYRYFRLSAKQPVLPGKDGKMVANVHLGKTRDTEKYQWAVAGILRRNQILRMKFYCEDFSFIDEFVDCRNWEFLDPEWQPNPDPLGQPDMRRKPARLANPNFVPVLRTPSF